MDFFFQQISQRLLPKVGREFFSKFEWVVVLRFFSPLTFELLI